ncbi:MAG: arginine--tRNA ligase [Candidatus Ratteibacteria bacterium]|nr:arginine--tRNA ligase [Candidatus Ratteibacteria bacterium]
MKQIKKEISELVEKAVRKSLENKFKKFPEISVEKTREEKFGDYSTNIALLLSREIKDAPVNIAAEIVRRIDKKRFSKVEVVPPGFINFFLNNGELCKILRRVLEKGKEFGKFENKHQKVQIEFVSANPTGPLHVGHGRGAAAGDCLANLLTAYGYKVSREYYINDFGNQIDTLGMSVKWRYLELLGEKIDFPEEWNGSQTYQGEYIKGIARLIKEKYGNKWQEERLSSFSRFAIKEILKGIKEDLELFGIRFDSWFKESELYRKKEVEKIEKILQKKGCLEEKDGAVWFKSILFGDTKNRVVIRKNKVPTYLASDIAYHALKFKHFHQVINVWGADHHGYIPRMKAAVKALGYDPKNLKIVLVQLVKLSRGGKQVPMSTRKGEFISLQKVLSEVGKDAARFIFMTRRSDAQLDFDLELAKKKSLDNPVYYIQYAHARLCNILQFAKNEGFDLKKIKQAELNLLIEKEELHLIKLLAGFPDVIEDSALSLEAHRLTGYLMEVAQSFHSFYSIHRVITENLNLSLARLALIKAIQITVQNALGLLGVDAPEKM